MQCEGDERAKPEQVERSYASECQTADNQQQNKLFGHGKCKACGGCDIFEDERESRKLTAHSCAVAGHSHPHSDNLFEIVKNKQQRQKPDVTFHFVVIQRLIPNSQLVCNI